MKLGGEAAEQPAAVAAICRTQPAHRQDDHAPAR
jgi:hypothetical protein